MSMAQILTAMPPPTRRLVVAAATLAAALEIFAWFAQAGPGRDTAQRVTALTESIRVEDSQIRRELERLNAVSRTDAASHTTTRFLKQIHDAISTSGVRVVRLGQRPKDEHVVEAELTAGLGNFLRFAVEVEALGASLRDLHVTRARETHGEPPSDDFVFVIEEPAGPGLRGKHIDELRALAADPKVREVFTPGGGRPAEEPRDLSTQYRLTAVTRIGSRSFATINDLDYQVGDAVGPMTLAEVAPDHVVLVSGSEHFVLRFQRKS
jgi:hypothetical protein